MRELRRYSECAVDCTTKKLWFESRKELVQTASTAHHASSIPLTVKRPWRKANRSYQSIAEVKNRWTYTSTSPLPNAFMIPHSNNFKFTVYCS
jgi:hypothetical protein